VTGRKFGNKKTPLGNCVFGIIHPGLQKPCDVDVSANANRGFDLLRSPLTATVYTKQSPCQFTISLKLKAFFAVGEDGYASPASKGAINFGSLLWIGSVQVGNFVQGKRQGQMSSPGLSPGAPRLTAKPAI
jgi:hypothetical protein